MLLDQKLGRYQLLEELGCGGMATVYRSSDPGLEREVAIKVMHPILAHRKDGLKRFKREAKAVARFKHENIVEVYDYSDGSDTGGSPYLVCELVNGPNLGDFLNTHGPPLPEMVAFMGSCLANALDVAHQNGIVHRDIKPENILVDPTGRLVLTDFGIARLQGDETMTATGAVMGSPAFMSPEQARGETLGPTSDIFSLGVVLYRMATGKLPFSGKNAISTVSALLKGDYTPPLVVRHDLGPDLNRIIQKCLHPKPEGRYSSMAKLAEDLREFAEKDGFLDGKTELCHYLRSPKNHLERLQDPIVKHTLERAKKTDSPALALALCDRVLAMDPENSAATEFLKELSADRTWKLLGFFGVGALLLGILAFLGVTFLLDSSPTNRKTPPETAAIAKDATAETDALSFPDGHLEMVGTDPLPNLDAGYQSPPHTNFRNTRPRSHTRKHRHEGLTRRPTATKIDAGVLVKKQVDASPPQPRLPRPPTVSHGTLTLAITPWCNATVDGHPVGRSPNLSKKIKIKQGKHQIVCSQGRGGPIFRRSVLIRPGKNLTVRGSILPKARVRIKLSPGNKVSIDDVTYSNGVKRIPARSSRVFLIKKGVPQKPTYISFPAGRGCTLVDKPRLKCR